MRFASPEIIKWTEMSLLDFREPQQLCKAPNLPGDRMISFQWCKLCAALNRLRSELNTQESCFTSLSLKLLRLKETLKTVLHRTKWMVPLKYILKSLSNYSQNTFCVQRKQKYFIQQFHEVVGFRRTFTTAPHIPREYSQLRKIMVEPLMSHGLF